MQFSQSRVHKHERLFFPGPVEHLLVVQLVYYLVGFDCLLFRHADKLLPPSVEVEETTVGIDMEEGCDVLMIREGPTRQAWMGTPIRPHDDPFWTNGQ